MEVLMRIVCALVVAVLTMHGQAWSASLSADHNEVAVAEIKALEFHLAKLLVSHAFDKYETYLAADYTRIDPDGVVLTREQVLAAFRASPPKGSMDPSELSVKVYGNTAILTGKLSETDSTGTRVGRFRKVFIRWGGRWFLVSLQGVALAGPH
jgi:hypothetical protein